MRRTTHPLDGEVLVVGTVRAAACTTPPGSGDQPNMTSDRIHKTAHKTPDVIIAFLCDS
jgi:hypothetical protein